MIINFNDRKIEVTGYEYHRDSGFIVYSANYVDGDMEDLNSVEKGLLEDAYFDQMYEAMPKGTGY